MREGIRRVCNSVAGSGGLEISDRHGKLPANVFCLPCWMAGLYATLLPAYRQYVVQKCTLAVITAKLFRIPGLCDQRSPFGKDQLLPHFRACHRQYIALQLPLFEMRHASSMYARSSTSRHVVTNTNTVSECSYLTNGTCLSIPSYLYLISFIRQCKGAW